jgi:hypothetical protein
MAKVLIKIGVLVTSETPLRNHPEIITRSIAIFNNLACIYERYITVIDVGVEYMIKHLKLLDLVSNMK